MKIVQLLERIEKAKEIMDEARLKKLDTILGKAEKLLMSAAKASGIRVDDIDELEPEEEEGEEDEGEEEEEELPEDKVEVETGPGPKPGEGEDKMEKIKATYGSLPPEKQTKFKERMGEKFNALGL